MGRDADADEPGRGPDGPGRTRVAAASAGRGGHREHGPRGHTVKAVPPGRVRMSAQEGTGSPTLVSAWFTRSPPIPSCGAGVPARSTIVANRPQPGQREPTYDR